MEQKITENYDLIKACQAGDEKAVEQLIHLYAASVHGLIYSIIGHREDVEDLAQETFLRMLTAIDRYQFRASFRSWLFRIAINLCRDQIRRKRVRSIISHYQSAEGEPVLKDQSQNPLGIVEQRDQADFLMKAINRLPHTLRIVLVLRDIQEMSYDEIASTLSWRMGTVKSRLFRARKELAKTLHPHLEELL